MGRSHGPPSRELAVTRGWRGKEGVRTGIWEGGRVRVPRAVGAGDPIGRGEAATPACTRRRYEAPAQGRPCPCGAASTASSFPSDCRLSPSSSSLSWGLAEAVLAWRVRGCRRCGPAWRRRPCSTRPYAVAPRTVQQQRRWPRFTAGRGWEGPCPAPHGASACGGGHKATRWGGLNRWMFCSVLEAGSRRRSWRQGSRWPPFPAHRRPPPVSSRGLSPGSRPVPPPVLVRPPVTLDEAPPRDLA